MKGKIDVNCVISKSFNGEFTVTTHALVKNLSTANNYSKNYDFLRVKPKHDLKFDAVQYLASLRNQLNELDNKGGIIFKDLDCEFIYAKRKNSDEYYHALIINLGNEEEPMIRAFYLTALNVKTLKKMKLEFQFTESEYDFEDDTEEDQE
ncbi:MAG: hypothetical protein R3Y05_02645 [bacterium]